MGGIRLLLGKSRWRRKRALPHEWLSGLDPTGRPTFLYLTDTWRKRQVVEREFEGQLCFAPPVRVMGELLDDLWLRHGDGRAVWSSRAEALIAERVLVTNPGRWPVLEALGRPRVVSRATSALLHDLEEAGLSQLPPGARHAAQLADHLSMLRRALDSRSDRITRAGSIRELLPLLLAPDEALLRWLRASHSVIIDDVLQPSPLRTEALLALCRAWSTAGAHVVLSFASGRDQGGREVGFFFEYDQESGYPLKPFEATSTLRRRVFDDLVSTGEASLFLALPDEVRPIEPFTVHEAPAPPDLSDFPWSDAPLPASTAQQARRWLRDRVRLCRCPTEEDELEWIAADVAETLASGVSARDCVVALPGLSPQRLLAAFSDHGVPVHLGAGLPLATHPLAVALRDLLLLPHSGWPIGELMSLAHRMAWPLQVHPRELLLWCRAAGIRAGLPSAWTGVLIRWLARSNQADQIPAVRQALEVLEQHCTSLVWAMQPHSPESFTEALWECMNQCGWEDLVQRTVDGDTTRALLEQTFAELVADLTCVHPDEWPGADLVDQFGAALDSARIRQPADSPDNVAVVDLLELRGLSPRRAWLGGLNRGRFPAARRPTALLDPALANRLDPVNPTAEARYLFHAALRNALDSPDPHHLVLSWSALVNGRPGAPSPVLTDLLDLRTTHPDGLRLGTLVTEDIHPAPSPRSRATNRRLGRVDEEWRSGLSRADQTRIAQTEQRMAAIEAGSRAWSGDLGQFAGAPDVLSVTALETLVRCPARYWYERVLDLRPDDPWSPELEPRRRGNLLHRVLQRFMEARGLTSLADAPWPDTARALYEAASEELDRVESEGGFEPAMQCWARQRWLAGLVDDAPRGVLASWLEVEIATVPKLAPEAVEQSFDHLAVGPVRVRGQLDRLDLAEGGVRVVTDYKTGRAPSSRQVEAGLALQPVLYAEAVRTEHPDSPVVSAWMSLQHADDVRRRTWSGDPQGLALMCNEADRRGSVPLDEAKRREVLQQAAAAAQGMADGQFPTTPWTAEQAGCATCPHARICRGDPASQAMNASSETP